ncbi:MAG: uridine diphosphate-N-acetylglucosamine-binding protein YvcK [Erysipelothrix sp.]|nr:uridine diphosphate-N-acetylglucosamine-binding protein YvcK [Erysipelothrix sp.]
MNKVTVIGGGTGQSIILKGIKTIDNISLSAIVTVSDDGGSTGKLRYEFNIPGMGDIRSVMVALAPETSLLPQILDYRFDTLDSKSLGGHNLGNLILTALTQMSGSFLEAVGSVSEILKVEGAIIPSSLQSLKLMARMQDGTIVAGESNIPLFSNNIKEVFYQGEVVATQEAVNAILESDAIILGVGSLYTSILPNVIIPEIKQALKDTKAKKIYYCNVMSQPGETDHYSVEDHVQALLDHMESDIDYVVVDNNKFSEKVIDKYSKKESHLVLLDKKIDHPYEIVEHDVVTVEDDLIRHDSDKIKNSFKKILEMI